MLISIDVCVTEDSAVSALAGGTKTTENMRAQGKVLLLELINKVVHEVVEVLATMLAVFRMRYYTTFVAQKKGIKPMPRLDVYL